jgi:predicted butyrate kinase (DUF1464 family)
MRSGIAAKIIAAIAATLAAEVTDKLLDWVGLSEEIAKLPREIIKAVAAAVAALLAEGILNGSYATAMDTLVSSEANPVFTSNAQAGLARAAPARAHVP